MKGTAMTGVVIGSMLGAAGLTMMLTDKNTRKRIAKDSARAMKRAGKMMDNMM